MQREELLSLLLDSWIEPVVFADTEHVIRYMNASARKHYGKWGDVVGKSLLDCHNENSVRIIKDCLARHQAGEDDILFSDNERHRVFSHAVRDGEGKLIGYYERYEPARGK